MDVRPYVEALRLLDDTDETKRRRQADAWNWRTCDYLPNLMTVDVSEKTRDWPRFDMYEQFHDKEKMLVAAIPGLMAVSDAPGDGIPSIRANHGCGNMATCLGAVNTAFVDKMPWVTEHATKERLSAMTPDDIDPRSGDFGRSLEFMAYFREQLEGRARVYCCDVQGPYDTAHLVYGDDIFMDMYDDPPFVQHLMALSTECIIRCVEAMKEVNGEPPDTAYHYNGLYAERGGIKVSEDTTTIISDEQMREFAVPWTNKLFDHFGGGWVHYCGANPHLTDCIYEDMPRASGINLGNTDMHEMDEILGRCVESGRICYYGGWCRLPGERDGEFLRRLFGAMKGRRTGLVFMGFAADADPAERTMDLWRSVQNEMLEPADAET